MHFSIDPQHIAIFEFRGLARQRFGDHPAAIEDFGTVLGLSALWKECHVFRAESLIYLGRFNEAITDLEAAIGKSASDWEYRPKTYDLMEKAKAGRRDF